MKRLFISMAALLLISVTATATDKGTDTMKLKATITTNENNPQKITLLVSNPASEKFSIDVYSREHGYLYTQYIAKGDFRANLDFTSAMDGDYTIEVSCSRGEKIRKMVTLQTKEVITRTASVK